MNIKSTHFFTEYYTDKYQILIPTYQNQTLLKIEVRLFKANGVLIGSYPISVVPQFILDLKDPECVDSEEEVNYLIDRFLNLRVFL